MNKETKDFSKEDAANLARKIIAKICDTDEQKLLEAFDGIDKYRMIIRTKRNGKKRKIFAPPDELLAVQKSLLNNFLYKSVNPKATNRLGLNPQLMGFIPKKSCAQHAFVHTKSYTRFVLKIDIQNAFPSVDKKSIENLFWNFVLHETRGYQKAREKRKEFFLFHEAGKSIASKFGYPPKNKIRLAAWKRRAGLMLEQLVPGYYRYDRLVWGAVVKRDFSWAKFYPKLPIFVNEKNYEYRNLIKNEGGQEGFLQEDRLRLFFSAIADQLASLVTLDGTMPQGAATSGFLFDLIVSNLGFLWEIQEIINSFSRRNTLSMYADDIVIGFTKKPDKETIEAIIRVVEKSKVFKINPEKTKLFDRRSIAPVITGFRLIRRPATVGELEADVLACVPGAKKRQDSGGVWYVDKISLPQKVQKKIRGLLHHATINEVDDAVHSRISGHLGTVVQAYGHSLKNIPNQLANPIRAYAKKYNKLKNFTD